MSVTIRPEQIISPADNASSVQVNLITPKRPNTNQPTTPSTPARSVLVNSGGGKNDNSSKDNNSHFRLVAGLALIILLFLFGGLFAYTDHVSNQHARQLAEAQAEWEAQRQAGLNSSDYDKLSARSLTADNGHITNLTTDTITAGDTTTDTLTVTGSTNLDNLVAENIITKSITADGSGLINLSADNIASGTLNDARLSTNVTLQGNTFNVANALLQLNSQGLIANALLQPSVSLLGQFITDDEVADNLTIDQTGSVHWLALQGYPSGCSLGEAIIAIDDTLTCAPFASGDPTDFIHNGTSAQTADFNITGDGTIGGTFIAGIVNATSNLQLNGTNINTAGTLTNVAYLNQANIFSASQTISTGTAATLALDRQGGKAISIVAGASVGALLMDSSGNFTIQARSNAQVKAGSGDDNSSVFKLDASGNLALGLGTTAPAFRLHLPSATTAAGGIGFGTDTNLYRRGASILATDGSLRAGGKLYVGTTAGGTGDLFIDQSVDDITGGLTIQDNAGSGQIHLYRDNTSGNSFKLETTGTSNPFQLVLNGTTVYSATSAGQLQLPVQGSAGGLVIGGDVQLYRAGANQLSLGVGNYLQVRPNAAGDAVLGSTINGNSINSFLIKGNGLIEWGDGTNARDTNLYRNAANTLKTDGRIISERTNTGAGAFEAQLAGDTFQRFRITANGQVQWGTGAAALDTNLYRSAADTLKTDDNFIAGGSVTAASLLSTSLDTPTAGTLNIGTATQTALNIGRSGANTTVGGGNVFLSGNTSVLTGSTFAIQSGWASITGLNSGSNTTLRVNNHTSTGSILVLQDAATDVLTVADGGSALFKNAVDSTTGFEIQNAGGSSMMTVDTTGNGFIYLLGGSTSTGCTLNGSNGNLTCSGNITSTASSGVQGWWSRVGTLLLPANTGDGIQTSGAYYALNPNNTSAYLQLSWLNDIPRIRVGGSGAGSSNGFQIQGISDVILLTVGPNGTLGVGQSANTYRISLPTSTAATGGIDFGGDTNLYRYAANSLTLGSNDSLRAVNAEGDSLTMQADATATFLNNISSTATDRFLSASVVGDTLPRIVLQADGALRWGSGSGATDTNLYRSAANVLKTEDTFDAADYLLNGANINTAGTLNNVAYLNQAQTFTAAQSINSTLKVGQIGGNGQLSVIPTAANLIGVVVRGASGQTADLQQWQDSNGNVLAIVNSGGSFGGQRFGAISGGKAFLSTADYSTSDTNAIMIQAAGTGANKGLVVRGAVGQSANLQEWQDSTGAVLAGISPNGTTYIGGAGALSNTRLSVWAGSATRAGLGISLAGSQTADAFYIQNSSSNKMTGFDAAGRLQFADGAGGAWDTNLYRSAADTLKTDDTFVAGGNIVLGTGSSGYIGQINAAAGNTQIFRGAIQGDVANRLALQANGTLQWGDGTNAVDTNLYRSAANALTTGGTLTVNGADQTWNAAAATLYVGMDTGTNRSINAAGSINASGADYAEWIPWSGTKPAQGSVVTYRGSTYIVSDPSTAAFVGNDKFDSDSAILVTFAGQVPVRITGTVHTGDILIDNGDGTAKGIDPATASLTQLFGKLGIAQEAGTGGTVKAAIGTTAANLSNVANNLQQGSTDFANLNVSGIATVATLNVTGNAHIGGNLTIAGALKLSDNQRQSDVAIGVGQQSIQVTFSSPQQSAGYAVSIEPGWLTATAVKNKTATGFTVEFDKPAPAGAKFDWLIVH